MNPVLAMLAVAAAFAVLMGGVLVLRKRGALGSEGSRKAMHMGMGIVTLGFPWWFQQPWPVLVLTGGFVALLFALRYVPFLRDRYGSVLCGVGRASWGEVYFPISVGTVFTLSHEQPLYYLIPVLILTFADATAALVGKALGRRRYLADEGEKSWEGSGAFLAVAFFCTGIPLVVAGWPPLHAALVALCIAVVTTLLEATAWRGLDNVFVPLSTLVMLRLYHDVPDALVLRHLGGLALLAALHVVLRRAALLREGTLLGALLVVYLCWTLGDIHWAFAPIVVLVTHRWLNFGAPAEAPVLLHSHEALLAFGLPSLGWLFADRLLGVDGFIPFNIAFGAHIALTAVSLWCTACRENGWLLLPPAAAIAWFMIILPLWVFSPKLHMELDAPIAAVAAVLFLAVGAALHVLQPRIKERVILHWATRAALAALASLAVL